MDALTLLRKSQERQISQQVGTVQNYVRHQAGNNQFASNMAEILKLPHVRVPAVQDLNPASSTFGKFYFMAGYSAVGGPDVIA